MSWGLSAAGAYAFKPSIGSVAPTKIGPPGDDVATGIVDDLSTTGLGPPVGTIDDGFKFSGEMTIRAYRPGAFSINDWTGYPSGISKPSGPFRLLQGEELRIAQRLKKNANARLSRELGLKGSGYEIHEIQPIKFGGSPTDISNKMLLRAGVHRGKVTPWWNALQRALEKTP